MCVCVCVCVRAKWNEVARLCPTLCDSMDCSLPDFSVYGVFQARILEWVAISFSKRSSRPRGWTQVSRIIGTREVCVCVCVCVYKEFPWWLSGKESACSAGDLGLIPGSGRSTGGGHGNPLQYSCLENPMDRGAWRAAVCGVVQSRTQLNQLSSHSTACVYKYIETEERDFLFFKTTDLWISVNFLMIIF